MRIATYQYTPEVYGRGTFFFTDCEHEMYSVKNKMAYHGYLCPGCLYKGKQVTLYIRGSKEANEYWKTKSVRSEETEMNDEMNDDYEKNTLWV